MNRCQKIIVGLVVQWAALQAGAAWTLPELLQEARGHHPSVLSARQAVVATESAREEVRRLYYPEVSALLETGSGAAGLQPSRLLRLEQTLWNAGATTARVDLATLEVAHAQVRFDEQSRAIELQVLRAWEAWLSAHGRAQVAQRLSGMLSDHLSMMQRRVRAGMSSEVEQRLVETQLMQADIDGRRARLDLLNARMTLEQLIGRPGQVVSVQVPESFANLALMRHRLSDLSNIDWSQVARSQPAVRLAASDLALARGRVTVKEAQVKPQVYLRVDQHLSMGKETTAFVGVRHTLGAGFSMLAEIQTLLARVNSQESALLAAELDVKQQIMLDVNSVQDNVERSALLARSVSTAQRIHESYVKQFSAGRKSWLDVMNAVRDLTQHEYALNEERVKFSVHLERLRLLAGATQQVVTAKAVSAEPNPPSLTQYTLPEGKSHVE